MVMDSDANDWLNSFVNSPMHLRNALRIAFQTAFIYKTQQGFQEVELKVSETETHYWLEPYVGDDYQLIVNCFLESQYTSAHLDYYNEVSDFPPESAMLVELTTFKDNAPVSTWEFFEKDPT